MAQLFRDDDACNYFFEIIKATKRENYIDDLVKMSKEATSSQAFGYALYDSGAFPQLSNLSRDFFAENYEAILNAMSSAGVFDAYILLVKQIMGDSTLISHEIKNPGHLIIKIMSVESSLSNLATSDDMQIATSELAGILVRVPVSDFAVMQLKKTLEVLCQPGGIYVELIFVYPDKITLNPTEGRALAGNSVQFNAEIEYTDGSISTEAQWWTSDSSIVTISSSGLATAVSMGSAQIYAAPPGNESFAQIAEFTSVEIDSVEISVSENIELPEAAIATVTYTDGSTVTSTESPDVVTWSSSDNDTLTVDGTGYCYPIEPGSATLTATSSEDTTVSGSQSDIQVFSSTIQIIIGQSSSGTTLGYQSISAGDESIGSLNWQHVGNDRTLHALRVRNGFQPLSTLVLGAGNGLWNDWSYITLTFRFADETVINYPGILTTPSLYIQTTQDSGIIDSALFGAMQSRIGQECYISAFPTAPMSGTIEIVIGEHVESSSDITYGLRSSVGVGELVSGNFPDGSVVTDMYARTLAYGEYLRSESRTSAWYGDFTLGAIWEFEDGTTFEALSSKLTYGEDEDEFGPYIRYKTSHIYDELIELMSTRVGERAKIHITHDATRITNRLMQVQNGK